MMNSDAEHVQALNRLIMAQARALSDLKQQVETDHAVLSALADEVSKIRNQRALEVRA